MLTLIGYQMLRCKLRCTKANGRITDNSHYHCCLCGRVLVRKVHLYCHLQAHSVGSMREIDEMLDAKDEAEEGPLEDSEMDEDDDNDTTLDTSQIATLDGSDQDNVVALSDGTQVTFCSIFLNILPPSLLCSRAPSSNSTPLRKLKLSETKHKFELRDTCTSSRKEPLGASHLVAS